MEDMCRKFDEATEDLYREIDKLFSGLTDSITAIFGIERSLERSVADIFFRQDTGESIPKVEQPLSRQLMLDEISGIEKDHADLMSSLYGELSQFLVVDVQELEFSQLLDVSKAIAGMIEDENLYGFCIVIKKMASDAHDVLHRLKVLKRNMRTDGGIVIAKSRDSRCISSLDFGEEDRLLISSSSSINQVASQLYKFPANISNEITQSLRHKGLLRYHAVPDILKKHTEDLKEKLKGVSGYGKKDTWPLTKSLLNVFRNWIFHVESILCTLVFEMYYLVSENETACRIFRDFKAKLEEMKKSYDGMVPISVYKILFMMDNQILLSFDGTSKSERMSTLRRGKSASLLPSILSLEMVIDDMLSILEEARPLVVELSLWLSEEKLVSMDDLARHEAYLLRSEEQLNSIEGILKDGKLRIEQDSDDFDATIRRLGIW